MASFIFKYQDNAFAKTLIEKLNNNDFGSVIIVHFCYFGLRKIILKVELPL